MGYNFFNIQPAKPSFEEKLRGFTAFLGRAIGKGEKIPFADNDVTYILKLQNDRIAEKGYELEYEVDTRNKGQDNFVAGSHWMDSHYSSTVCFRFCDVKRVVRKGGRKLFRDKRKSVLYGIVTDVLSNSHPENDSFCCPNCGAVTTIAELQEGCPYCSTMYKMDDLFPRITDYYFLDDGGLDKDGFKKGFFSFMGLWMIIFLAITCIVNPESFKNIFTLIGLIFGLIFGSAVLGYFTFSIFLLFRTIVMAVLSAGKMGTAGSRMRFEARMKKVSPEFSFEYFTSKAISLIKTAVYSKDEGELLFYKGEPLPSSMKHIIDLNYGGALGLNRFKEKDGIVTVETRAFFDVLYAKDKRVRFKHQIFYAKFQRRVDIPVDFNFSMTRICCPTCGSSFDATKNKFCPSCGHEYEIISNDWVLVELRTE